MKPTRPIKGKRTPPRKLSKSVVRKEDSDKYRPCDSFVDGAGA